MLEAEYSETTTPVPGTTMDEQEAGGVHFGGEIGVKGELYLSVDKDEYRAGDLVTGRITVLVSEPLQCGGASWVVLVHCCVRGGLLTLGVDANACSVGVHHCRRGDRSVERRRRPPLAMSPDPPSRGKALA